MKKIMVVLAAMAFVIVMAGSALASDTSNVNVSAKVNNVCSVLATMTIGEIAVDLSQAGPYTGSTSGNVRCTNNHDFQINVSSADVTTPVAFVASPGVSGFKMHNGSDVLNYSVYNGGAVDSSGKISGLGFSTDLAVGITASIPKATNEAAPAQTYTDTVYLTIVY